jgi:hypothetical protein
MTMDRDGMSMMVRMGGQWISLDAYRKMKRRNLFDSLLLIAVIIAAGAAIFTFLIPAILLIARGM